MTVLKPMFKWLALGLAMLALVLALCWWLIPDEALNPEVENFLALPLAPATQKNAYFMLWGLRASPELDPHAVGQKIVVAIERLIAAQKGSQGFDHDAFLGPHPLTYPDDARRLCEVEKQNCLQVYQAHRAEVESELASKKVFVERYRRIRAYEESAAALSQVTWDTPLPPLTAIMRISDLVDASIALRMTSRSTHEAALRELGAEIDSWKRLLASNDVLVMQMISTMALHRKYRLASEIMNAYPAVPAQHPDLMKGITAPVPVTVTIVNSLKEEMRVTVRHLWDIGQEQNLYQSPFEHDLQVARYLESALTRVAYRPNASINISYARFKAITDLYARSPKEVLAGHDAMLQQVREITATGPSALFYNFAGRLIIGRSFPDAGAVYAFRIHDLIGLSRLLELQRLITEAQIPAEQVAAALPGFGDTLVDPYTERPMQWDAPTRTLSFELHGKRFANFGFVQVAPTP